ncbi:rotamase-domain-containing protein [Tricholoma matsutake]|nr:rotamase-domain-containing protein [Tricholoma matsutake 945]
MSEWEVRLSNSRGVPYFFNVNTNRSSWEPPPTLTKDQINQLPGAKEHLSKSSSSSGPATGQVRASHLLVKHRGSRRPSSWKEANITRSKEEAIEILQHSDCSSHTNSGDLGWFGHGQMQKPFEDAAYGLQVGQISDIISSDSGVHLVMRTG